MSNPLDGLQTMLQPYLVPLLIVMGIALAVWLVFLYRGLQAHKESEGAQIERMLKKRE